MASSWRAMLHEKNSLSGEPDHTSIENSPEKR
jgi:hypothetical protein